MAIAQIVEPKCIICDVVASEDEVCYGCGAYIHDLPACSAKDKRCESAMGRHEDFEHLEGTEGGCGRCGTCDPD